eukprot:767304-Hanusia_phi.AAC.3
MRRYEGEWKSDKKHGAGNEFERSEQYQVEYDMGRLMGYHLKRYPDGSSYAGEWHAGRWHGKGEMSEGCEEQRGRYRDADSGVGCMCQEEEEKESR